MNRTTIVIKGRHYRFDSVYEALKFAAMRRRVVIHRLDRSLDDFVMECIRAAFCIK
jgi:hypothetical protein